MKNMNPLIKTFSSVALAAVTLTAFSVEAAYKVVEVANGGSISGTVTLKKDPKSAHKVYKIKKDVEVCGSGERKIDYVQNNGKALLNTVVYLTKVKKGEVISMRTRGQTAEHEAAWQEAPGGAAWAAGRSGSVRTSTV